jgi:non-ribosomal peptide synthetase component F
MQYTPQVCYAAEIKLSQRIADYLPGSTGTPKGVDVSHANVTNALLLEPANLGIKNGSKVGSVLSVAFDMGAWEILACLMNGGTLYMRGSQWTETLKEVTRN